MSDWSSFPEVSEPLRVTVRPQGATTPQPNSWDAYPEVGVAGTVKDIGQSLGIGGVKGGINMLGLPGDVSALGAKGIDTATRFVMDKLGMEAPPPNRPEGATYIPGSQDIQHAVEGYTGEFYKPKTTAGRYAETIGEFLPAVAAGPGGIARRVVAGAVVPGAASEAAGQATEGTALEPYARAAAALVAGAGAILAAPGKTTSAAISSQLPEYVTPAVVQRAELLINHAKSRGVDLTWPEAMSRITGQPVLTDMQRILESAPQSRTRMQSFFADRPQQVEGAVRGELGTIAPPTGNPSTIGPAVGTAAEGAVNDVRGAINKAAKPFYDAAGPIRLTPKEMKQVYAVPGYAEAADAVRKDVQLNRHVAHLPEDSIGFLNEVKKYLDQQAINSRSPLQQNPNMQRTAGLGLDATAVRNAAANAGRDTTRQYATALAVESVARERFLNPLLEGPLGTLANRDITTRKAIDALFPASPLANSEHEIATAVSAVAKRHPGAASQLVRAHIEGVFNDAATSLQSGANQAVGAKFFVRLVGNPQQRENLRAAIEALPNGTARWQGMQELLDIAEATGTRQAKGSLTSFNTEELKLLSAGNRVAETVKTAASPGKWWSFVNDKWNKWQVGQNLNGLARIITDPASGPLLEKLAGLPRHSNAAGAVAARLILMGDAATTKERGRGPN